MKKLLLDTHTMIWWHTNAGELGPKAHAALSDRSNDVLITIVALWEVLIKARARKRSITVDDMLAASRRNGFTILGVEPAHLAVLEQLPIHHGDPFAHLLIAQAVAEEAIFVTANRVAAKYPVERLNARR